MVMPCTPAWHHRPGHVKARPLENAAGTTKKGKICIANSATHQLLRCRIAEAVHICNVLKLFVADFLFLQRKKVLRCRFSLTYHICNATLYYVADFLKSAMHYFSALQIYKISLKFRNSATNSATHSKLRCRNATKLLG